MSDLAPVLSQFADKRILVIGDIMLDRYIHGHVDRISPEAPVPVITVQQRRSMLGGAGNVAMNLLALGAQVSLATVVGNDRVGHEITGMVGDQPHLRACIATETGRVTTKKTRYVAGAQQLMRADAEEITSVQPETLAMLIAFIREELPLCDGVILSDYGKGVFRDMFAATVIALARQANKPTFVDPKRDTWQAYSGATVIKPNLHELRMAAMRRGHGAEMEEEGFVPDCAYQLQQRYSIHAVLVTLGRGGMTLVEMGSDALHLPTRAHDVYDVSGAGDTVIATMALGVCCGIGFPESARLANIAAGIVVGRIGTSTVTAQDIAFALAVGDAFSSSGKVVTAAEAAIRSAYWTLNGFTVAFTNGCFDLMHSGHLHLLQGTIERAKALSAKDGKLIVGVNSDASVRKLKGEGRPVNSAIERAQMIAALAIVDLVVIFDEPDPLALIRAVRPQLLTKGSDYAIDQVCGADFVLANGGEVDIIPRVNDKSTTSIMEACRFYNVAARLGRPSAQS